MECPVAQAHNEIDESSVPTTTIIHQFCRLSVTALNQPVPGRWFRSGNTGASLGYVKVSSSADDDEMHDWPCMADLDYGARTLLLDLYPRTRSWRARPIRLRGTSQGEGQ